MRRRLFGNVTVDDEFAGQKTKYPAPATLFDLRYLHGGGSAYRQAGRCLTLRHSVI
jgi:hypothetical protein